jgi:RND family efflux transporter MFP subunit
MTVTDRFVCELSACPSTDPLKRVSAHPYFAANVVGFTALLLATSAVGCNTAASKTPDRKPPNVVITTPVVEPQVVDYQDFTGRLDSIQTIDIRARASGFIKSAPFKEGDLVKQGDLLFQVDPIPYLADYNLAEANLKLAEADQNLQQKNAVRAAKMMKANAVAQEDYDTAIATWEKSQATVAAMAATRDRAKEYLSYTKVIAPVTGRISRRLVDPGNLVNADNTILTTLVQDDTLYAYFDVDERTYLEMGGSKPTGSSSTSTNLQFPVLFRLANEEQFQRSGIVNFIDNRVTAGTGTIRMRAIFDNKQGELRAGLFVRIRLPIGAPYAALVVPSEAVLSDQGRKYVYTVNNDNKVVYTKVTLGQEISGLRVVRTGLEKDSRVMIIGMQRVTAGAVVDPKTQAPPAPPGSPLGKLLTSAAPATSPPADSAPTARVVEQTGRIKSDGPAAPRAPMATPAPNARPAGQ